MISGSVGGAQIIHYLLKHDLLDELILSIHPIILGDGIPLLLQCAIAQETTLFVERC
ncbi:dihydrofolate reductase family protein [Tolypothrix sp. NIES-4075]|uniref:dihydrofolate reductase family protein n=1 Tax=Tolypothrix sp. NIES-4075 TaxID=2005459 RepID=UPI001F2EA9B8|nr:dihydrofolate reductase family protein [Tolypothrix sp. NIES-4075]